MVSIKLPHTRTITKDQHSSAKIRFPVIRPIFFVGTSSRSLSTKGCEAFKKTKNVTERSADERRARILREVTVGESPKRAERELLLLKLEDSSADPGGSSKQTSDPVVSPAMDSDFPDGRKCGGKLPAGCSSAAASSIVAKHTRLLEIH